MNNNQKTAVKVFIFLFVFSFIIINWNDVSWVFNYREWEGLTHDFFNPYGDSQLLVQAQSLNVNKNPAAPSPSSNMITYSPVALPSFISIPALSLTTPVVVGRSSDKNDLMKDLDLGAPL
ncbi:hypothetical protein KW786_03920, partial [Candidatus Parcubacteria bacterium]|nr:hypothetical protein [Candidatus Parcubacteria bacterium]